MFKITRKVYFVSRVFSMPVQNEKKEKSPPSLKGASKNGKEYYSDNDSTSTGSSESVQFLQTSSNKKETTHSTSPVKEKRESKSLRKKFFHHFPNVEEDEEVLKRYSCALLSDLLLQGALYITTNYFGFYSNVFGYVTKLLIPVLTIEDITKEKTAKIFPNAIGIVTPEQKHVFGSFMSRDNTLDFMRSVWEKAKSESALLENELSEQSLDYISDMEEDETEENIEEDEIKGTRKVSDAVMKLPHKIKYIRKIKRNKLFLFAILALLLSLYISASLLLYRISQIQDKYSQVLRDVDSSGSHAVYLDLVEMQKRLYIDSATRNIVDTNLDQISKVKQSLEALSTLLVDEVFPHEDQQEEPS